MTPTPARIRNGLRSERVVQRNDGAVQEPDGVLGENGRRAVLHEVTHCAHLSFSQRHKRNRRSIGTTSRSVGDGQQIVLLQGTGVRLDDLIALRVPSSHQHQQAKRLPDVGTRFSVLHLTMSEEAALSRLAETLSMRDQGEAGQLEDVIEIHNTRFWLELEVILEPGTAVNGTLARETRNALKPVPRPRSRYQEGQTRS